MSLAANGKSLACGEWQISNLRFSNLQFEIELIPLIRYLKFEI